MMPMRPVSVSSSGSGSSDIGGGIDSGGGGGGGAIGVAWSASAAGPDPRLSASPLPAEDAATLSRLLAAHGDGPLGDRWGDQGEAPLLVPLLHGAATNVDLGETYGEAQEALIARYLLLMGTAQQPHQHPHQHPHQQHHTQVAAAGWGDKERGAHPPARPGAAPRPQLHLDLSHLPPRGTDVSGGGGMDPADSGAEQPVDPQQSAALLLRSLGLDRPSLERRSVPDALIGALHRSLAASAAAFFRSCLAERRKLAALTHGSGPTVPLADRLLAFITGTEGQLTSGSALPDMDHMRQAKDVQTILDAVMPPQPLRPSLPPYHHELMHARAQPPAPPAPPRQPAVPQPGGAGAGLPPPAQEPDLEELMDLDRITALASAGNVPGLRALLRGLVGALDYSRTSLRAQLAAEGQRAQREWERGEAVRGEVAQLRVQLAGRNRVVAERGAELEAACRRAALAEESLLSERGVSGGLRGQLRSLTAEFEAQHRDLKANLESQIAGLREALPVGADASALGGQLATARSDLALAELRHQQERAVAGQLRVMLDSARGSLGLHVGRAAAATAEVERLTRLVAAAQDLANASSGGLGLLEQQLAQEKAAHRRTTERLQAVNWRVEQARCGVVDMRARAAHGLRQLQAALGDSNLRAVTAERQLADATWELWQTKEALQESTCSLQALRERSTRMEAEAEAARQQLIASQLDGAEGAEQLRATRAALQTAEARIAQLQQQVMDDTDAVLAGKAATTRLADLEKEHNDLQSSFSSLSSAHESLAAAHAALTAEMGAARLRVTELERRDALLVDLTARHEKLMSEHSRLRGVHEQLDKQHTSTQAAMVVLKRHTDALAGQVQEYRYKAERAAADLEAEREAHRHTQAELEITTANQLDLAARCEALTTRVDEMEAHVAAADAEAARCRRAAELAEQQRAEAFALRDAWTRVRLLISSDVREYLSAISGQLGAMEALLAGSRAGLTELQARLLDIPEGTLEGTGVAAPQVPFDMARKLCDSLFRMVSSGTQLLETQSEIRRTLLERLDHVEDGLQARLASATDYWRQVLALSRGSPRAMVQVVERMTGQVCRELELDPTNPLARMVPIGVLEEAGVELSMQHERVGGLRGSAHSAEGRRDAADKLLVFEREVSAARAAEFQSLVSGLSGEVGRLRGRVAALTANNAMQQQATADMQRMLSDAEWKVSKAVEREALLGAKFLVPLGRESRAVQTVFSDMHHHHAMTAGAGAGAGRRSSSPSPQHTRPHSRAHQGGRSDVEEDEATAGTGEWRLQQSASGAVAGIDIGGGGGGASRAVDEAFDRVVAVAAAAAATSPASSPSRPPPPHVPALGLRPPDSPASLPPLSALNSPAGGAAMPLPLSPRGSGAPASPGLYSSALRLASGASNLSRATNAASLPHQQRAVRPMSAVGSPMSGGSLVAVAADARGHSHSNPASPRPATTNRVALQQGQQPQAAVGAMQQLQQQRLQQRRRHPDQVAHGSSGGGGGGGGWVSLPAVASVSEMAGGGGESGGDGDSGGGGGRYTSEDGGLYYSEPDMEYEEEEYNMPPPALRTPSTSTTAAAAAAFAACGGHPLSHPRSASSASLAPGSPLPSASLLPPARPATAHGGMQPQPPGPRPPPLGGTAVFASPPGSPVRGGPSASASTPITVTASGIPHSWQHSPWDWLADAAVLASRGAAAPYSRQSLLELLADIHYTKALHDQVSSAASFPATSMQQYVGAYFEARHGPRGGLPPASELALAQLLMSLEAHSALYEVMLFARVAGLQAWTGKPAMHRNTRPSTARPLTASSGGGGSGLGNPVGHQQQQQRARPASSRPGLHGSPAGSVGGGFSLSPASPRSPAAGGGAAAARGGRVASARNHGGGGSNSVVGAAMLGGMPPPYSEGGGCGGGDDDPSASGAAAGGPGGETTLRLRTGLAPSVATSLHGQQQRHANARSTAGAAAGGAAWPPHPHPGSAALSAPKLRLQGLRPELLVSEALGRCLERLGEVGGMEALAQFVSAGRLLGRLRQSDLGAPLPEEQHPEMHYAVAAVVSSLGLPEAPELLLRDSASPLPYGADVMLLQLPNVGTDSLAYLAATDVDRPPAASAGAAASTAPGGWRRRAVLLLSPALVAAVAAAATSGSGVGAGGAAGQEELAALLGAALAPMLMPGGYGWRFDLQAGGALGPTGLAPPPASAAPSLLSAAEVVTAVNVAALKPTAALAALPSQLKVKWERLLGHLRLVAAAATAAADRGALLASQSLAPAVRAAYRAAAGVSVGAAGADGRQKDGAGPLGSGEELVLQAQATPWSDTEIAANAALPTQEAAASGADRRRHALARVAMLARWAEGQEYRQTLRAAVLSC